MGRHGWLAILTGLLVTSLLSLTSDALVCRILFTMIGGFVASAISPARPPEVGFAMGALLMWFGLALALVDSRTNATWHVVAVALTAPPSAWIGARIFIYVAKSASRSSSSTRNTER